MAGRNRSRVRVWDRFVRLFHWALVLSFFGAYATIHGPGWVHRGLGHLALALVIARVVWGLYGSRHALFSQFVPGPAKLLRYLSAVLQARERRHLGHNPAGAVMIVALLVLVSVIGISGWMMNLDAFWGDETVERVHVVSVNITLVAIAIHVLANLYASWRHRENLIWSMVTGYKRALPGRHQRSRQLGPMPLRPRPARQRGIERGRQDFVATMPSGDPRRRSRR